MTPLLVNDILLAGWNYCASLVMFVILDAPMNGTTQHQADEDADQFEDAEMDDE